MPPAAAERFPEAAFCVVARQLSLQGGHEGAGGMQVARLGVHRPCVSHESTPHARGVGDGQVVAHSMSAGRRPPALPQSLRRCGKTSACDTREEGPEPPRSLTLAAVSRRDARALRLSSQLRLPALLLRVGRRRRRLWLRRLLLPLHASAGRLPRQPALRPCGGGGDGGADGGAARRAEGWPEIGARLARDWREIRPETRPRWPEMWRDVARVGAARGIGPRRRAAHLCLRRPCVDKAARAALARLATAGRLAPHHVRSHPPEGAARVRRRRAAAPRQGPRLWAVEARHVAAGPAERGRRARGALHRADAGAAPPSLFPR